MFPCPEDAANMDAALHWLCNRILGAVAQVGLDKVTPGWRTAEILYGIDATVFPANARPYKGVMCSFDRSGGLVHAGSRRPTGPTSHDRQRRTPATPTRPREDEGGT